MLNHRFYSSFFLLMALCLSSFAQIGPRLQQQLNVAEKRFHLIKIEFKENVDCYALNHEFKQQRLEVSERPKVVIHELQQQAAISQTPVLQLLNGTLRTETKDIHPFWIVNTIILRATETAIQQLSAVPTVALIEVADADIIAHDPIIRAEGSAERSPNGVEPGLVAINAPAMWALGYTGRGRLVYDYDTGVWPTHPAFSYRFLANRYPMQQCWTGFFSNVPNGNISDHGTHTLGTMAGLVEETNDTIGVAFGSYWIANDFVTSTVEALPPLAAMIGAFEWALNPDGDINTTDDIPDVINNSWRWRDDPDTVQCAGMVVNLMNAIEAAGIANIFSGGNSGPSNTTVNAPQRINTSEVNTFSVGSVNGNSSFPYPISEFSTRGPSQCPSGGNLSLEIHPEVVAPGQNVRSAWGTDEFNSISGTSMAAPHVSGAILLLKEAFPYLSGEDLMWALYQTAVDLGDVGEDNVFGMGIIDVYAAYLQLAQTNTPIDPNNIAWDLEITGATNPVPNGITCDNEFQTTVTIKNRGSSTISSVLFSYNINGTTAQTHSWSGTLAAGESTDVQLPAITTAQFGNIDLNISASIVGQSDEYDLYNNRWRINFNRRESRPLPFTEDFDQGFGLNDWLVDNEDGSTTWDTVTTGGLTWNSYSASVQLYNYNPRTNQKDGLISPILEIPNTTEPIWLLFDEAYQSRSTSNAVRDTLQILVSTNCGQSFDELVYQQSGPELSTNDTNQLNFVPEFEWDWRQDSVNLTQFSGEDVLLQFRTINRKGNNIYIDNVKVFTGDNEPENVPDHQKLVSIYPNPTNGDIFITAENNDLNISSIRVRNVIGQELPVEFENMTSRVVLRTGNLKAGIYFIDMTTNGYRVVKRLVKQ
ncbi:MAG: S8 family serine peptidase [Flavobacteriales bacterium]|nr:S8 family serine peptidase [Flavobacteriales bacterium]